MKKILVLLVTMMIIFSCGGDENKGAAGPDAGKAVRADAGQLTVDESASDLDVTLLLAGGGAAKTETDAESGIVREGWDLSETTVNYFSLDSLPAETLDLEDDGKPLTIEEWGPRGSLPRENRTPVIRVSFSHPMVPLSRLGAPMREHEGMSVEPEISGTYRWYGTRMLSFEPDEVLQSQQEYVVSVSGELKSLGGKSLSEPFSFSFTTEPLDIASMRPGTYDLVAEDDRNVPPGLSGRILLSFTEPVDIEHIKNFINIESGGEEYQFSLERPASEGGELDENYVGRTVQILLAEEPEYNSEVVLSLAEGASSAPGLNGRKGAVSRRYHTLTPFSFERQSSYSHAFPRSRTGTVNPVFIRMSQPVRQEGVADLITTSFGPLENWKDRIEVWNNIIRINDLPVEYGSSYEITLSAELSDVYGQSLGDARQIEVEVPDAASYAYFPGGRIYRSTDYNFRMLEAQFRPRIVYEYQNIDSGSIAVSGVSSLYDRGSAAEWSEIDFSEKKRNEANYEIMDLSPWLGEEGFGSVRVNWDFVNPSDSRWADDYKQNLVIQVTDLGITMRYAYNRVLVWVNSLSSGEPVRDAEVSIGGISLKKVMKTNSDGLAVFELGDGDNMKLFDPWRHSKFKNPVTVEVNGDRADFIAEGSHSPYRFGIWSRSGPYSGDRANPVTYIFTDRGLYKPGETVSFRGIDWDVRLGEFEIYQGAFDLTVKKQDYRSRPFIEQNGVTTSGGGFYGEIDLPEELEPGTYEIRYTRAGEEGYTPISFKVANFRRLNFQVRSSVPDRLYFLGDTISVPVEASYLAGGAMANAEYRYFWTREPSYFRPENPEFDDWVFGPGRTGGVRTVSSGKGKLSAGGSLRAEQQSEDTGMNGQPMKYILETTVEDIDRQEITSRAAVTVHPGGFYIGAKLKSASGGWWSRFVPADTEQTAEFVLLTPGGEVEKAEKEIRLDLIKRDWVTSQQQGVYGRVNRQYTRVDKVVESMTVDCRGGRAEAAFTPDEPGSYILRAETEDEEGRRIVTDMSLYATGASWVRWANSGAADINLIVDKNLYDVGDTARVLVQSPVPDGKYLMTVEREGIFEEKIVELSGSSGIIELPITEEHVPVIYLSLCSQQARTSTSESYYDPDLGKPKGFFGLAEINVSTVTRELDIEIIPDSRVHKPGENMDVKLRVTRDGKPVADSEMSFLAVDRGVLDLIDYHVPNPLTHFYDPDNFIYAVAGDDSRRLLLDPVTYDVSELQGGDGAKLKRREDFVPLAVFEPFLKTDIDGIARVNFDLPDTLTTYRATAIALSGGNIGYSEDEFIVQNPINVRTALPRMLRYRDTAVGGLVIQNLDDKKHSVKISLEADGITVGGDKVKTVEVPAMGRYEAAWVLNAEDSGEARFLFTIESEVLNEQLAWSLDIETPLVKESFTAIGTADSTTEAGGVSYAEEVVIMPSSVRQGWGGISIQLDSTKMPLAREPLRRLLDYRIGATSFLLPYGYHALPGLLFGDGLPALLPDLAGRAEGAAEVYFRRAANYQLSDGGIRMSQSGIKSSPRASLQTAELISAAEAAGAGAIIPGSLNTTKLNEYLAVLAADKDMNLAFRTHAAELLAERGWSVDGLCMELLEEEDSLGLAGYARLACAFAASGNDRKAGEIFERMNNFLEPGTRSADLIETYEKTGYFDSETQQLALFLKTAVRLGKGDDLIRRLTESLGRRISAERWLSYQDCETAALAFGALFRNESGAKTDFNAGVTIGDGEFLVPFKGISEAPEILSLKYDEAPLSGLGKDKAYKLRIEKDGEGELFYSATTEYALPSEIVQPRDEGISVYTEIETLDGKPVEEGRLELGQTYRCRAVVSSSRDRTFLSMSVPIPSGAEILDSTFVTTSSYADQGGLNSEEWTRETVHGDSASFSAEGIIDFGYDGWWMHYYRPEMLIYDNEMIYEWEYFYRGERRVTFLFKATTPGIYPTPPAQASILTEPEVFGRTGGGLFVIR